jgi:ribosomal protein S8
MSLVNLAHVCSHLQNASRARLGTTAIPLTNLHLRLAQQMQKAGFLSSVTIAGLNQPPTPSVLGSHPDPVTTYTTKIPAHWARNPSYRAEDDGEASDEGGEGAAESAESAATPKNTSDLTTNNPYIFVPQQTHTLTQHESLITKDSVATRRIWLGLKYWDNRPVIEHMRLVSKPTRRIWAGAKNLADLARGRDWQYVRGVRQVGECLFVTTDRGILEVREAAERGVGGMLLCRIW